MQRVLPSVVPNMGGGVGKRFCILEKMGKKESRIGEFEGEEAWSPTTSGTKGKKQFLTIQS